MSSSPDPPDKFVYIIKWIMAFALLALALYFFILTCWPQR